MDKLFSLLAIACVICLVGGLIRPSKSIIWGAEEKKTRKNVLKYYGIAFIVCLALFVITTNNTKSANTSTLNTSNTNTKTSTSTKAEQTPHSISLYPEGQEDLNNVTIVKSDVVNYSGYSLSIVGISFDKSSGDSVLDSGAIGTGLINNIDDSVSRGMDMGFKNSSDSEIAKKDAYFCLYLKYTFDESKTSQRDSIIPNITISAKDDQDDNFSLIHYSLDNKYINVDYPYGLVMFKGYYDSKFAYININGTDFEFDLTSVKSN